LLSNGFLKKNSFEFMAALIISKVLQKQWSAKTYIGFYLEQEHARLLEKSKSPDWELYATVLQEGIRENHEIDFIVSTSGEETDYKQEIQLKRFGLNKGQQTTEELSAYLNSLKDKYGRTETSLLVALVDVRNFDFPTLNESVVKDSFPFEELILFGVIDDREVSIINLIPESGFSIYQLSEIL
jgi:hypothetical protein